MSIGQPGLNVPGGGGGGATLTYTPTTVAAGAPAGTAAGSLTTTLTGTVSYAVLSGAISVASGGAVTTTGTAPSNPSGATIAAVVSVDNGTDGLIKHISVPVSAGASATYLPSVSGTMYWAIGTRKMISAYSGPALQHRNGSGTLTDVAFSGQDMTGLGALGVGTVATWYDQSGGGYHHTQSNASLQPTLNPNITVRGTVPVIIDSNAASSVYKSIGRSSAAFDTHSLTIYDVAMQNSSYQSSSMWNFTDGSSFFRLTKTVGSPGWQGFGAGAIPRAQLSVTAWRASASAVKLWVNEQTFTGSPWASTITTAFMLGSESTYQTFMDRSFRMASIAFIGTHTDAEVASMISALISIYNVQTTFDRRIIEDGDSIKEGYVEAYLQNDVNQSVFSGSPEVFNIALGGQTMQARYADRANCRDLLYTTAYGNGKCIFISNAGTNDMVANSTTPANLYNNYTTPWITSAKALGAAARVGIADVITRGNLSDTTRHTYNNLVTGNAAGADFVVDVGSDAYMGLDGGSGNTTYFSGDLIHPTAAGAARLASYYGAAL